MTCVAISCGLVGGVVGVHCESRVGDVGDGWRMSARSDVKNVVGDEGQEVEQQ